MRATPLTWATRLLWFAIPLTLGDLIGDALAEHSSAVQITGSVLAWLGWVAGLGAALVPLPVTLTVMRILAPLPVVAGTIAAIDHQPDALGWVGLAIAVVAATCAASAEVGEWFVNGASYGDERRMPLRPPIAVLIGPVEIVWLLTVAPVVGGVMALAARAWLLGAVLSVIGIGTASVGFRILDRLTRRWVVFVPAGMTLVDPLALADAMLLPRTRITRLGPAPADTDALDLTAGAAGLILQADLDSPVELVPAVGRGRIAEVITSSSVLFAPSRPGAVLAEAEKKRVTVVRA